MLSCKTGLFFAPYVRTVFRDSIHRLSLTTRQYALRSNTLCSASLSSSFGLRSREDRSFLAPLDFDPSRNLVRFQHQKTKEKLDVESAETEKSAGAVAADGPPGEAKLSQGERMKRAVREYGATVIVFHTCISLFTLGVSYAVVSSGIDIVGIMTKIGIGQSILESKLATGTSTFVIAYAVHKVFVPVRMACTLTATPFIVRYLRRIGFLKAPVTKS